MNEKELLKKISDKEFPTRGSSLSADEVLGTSVSGRARVRTGGWKIALAVVTAAAVAVGTAVFLNRSAVPKDTESTQNRQAESVPADLSAGDRPYLLGILDDMRAHPENYLTEARSGMWEGNTWTKNGAEVQGMYHEMTERSYEELRNDNRELTGYKDTDPTPVIEFMKLIDAHLDSCTIYGCSSEDIGQEISLLGDGVFFAPKKDDGSLGDAAVIFSVTDFDFSKRTAFVTVRFYFQNDPAVGGEAFSFKASEEDMKVYEDSTDVYMELGGITWSYYRPHLPKSYITDKCDTVYAGSIDKLDSMTVSCTGARPEQQAQITLSVDHENNKLIIDTDICDSRTDGSDITLKGAVFVPPFSHLDVSRCVMDGRELKADDPLISSFPAFTPADHEETFGAQSHNKHHYELWYDSGISAISLASLYDTVVPDIEDGLPDRFTGDLVIRFEDDPAHPQQDTEVTDPDSDKAFYLDVLDRMRDHPEYYLTSTDTVYRDYSRWTVNGVERIGGFVETSEASYELDRDDNGIFTGEYRKLDPTPVIELVKLIDSQNKNWETSSEEPEDLNSTLLKGLASDSFAKVSAVYFETRNDTPEKDRVKVCLTVRKQEQTDQQDSGLWVKLLFDKGDGTKQDVNCISFFVDAEKAKLSEKRGIATWELAGIFYRNGVPHLPMNVHTYSSNTVYAGSFTEVNTLNLTCTGTRPEQKANVILNTDHENNKLIIDTDICDSRTDGSDITLSGKVFVPYIFYTRGLQVKEYLMDGKPMELNDPIVSTDVSGTPPEITETFGERSHNAHRYEITFEGDISDLNWLWFVSLYDTVVPYDEDGLPERYAGNLIIRFEDDPYKAPLIQEPKYLD